jgi:HSP20 family protein
MTHVDDWQREVERYLEHFARARKRPTIVFTQQAQLEPLWSPAVDLYETAEAVVVVLELPGIDPDQTDIQVELHRLTVRGVRRDRHVEPTERRSYHALEIRYGRFERSLPLPPSVDGSSSSARYRDGLLEITLPKRTPTHVKIDVTDAERA